MLAGAEARVCFVVFAFDTTTLNLLRESTGVFILSSALCDARELGNEFSGICRSSPAKGRRSLASARDYLTYREQSSPPTRTAAK